MDRRQQTFALGILGTISAATLTWALFHSTHGSEGALDGRNRRRRQQQQEQQHQQQEQQQQQQQQPARVPGQKPKADSPPPPGARLEIRGLRNLGNTCFLNALLQALASVHPFVHWLQALAEHRGSRRLTFTRAILEVMDELSPRWVVPRTIGKGVPVVAFAPHVLKRALPKQFKGQSQQDADELFRLLLDAVEAESAHQRLQISPLSLMATALTTQGGDGCGGRDMIGAAAGVMSMAASEFVAGEVLEEWGYRRLLQPQVPTPFSSPTSAMLSVSAQNDSSSSSTHDKECFVSGRDGCETQCPFGGWLATSRCCCVCGHTAPVKNEPFNTLSVTLPDAVRQQHMDASLLPGHLKPTLDACLSRFISTELVDNVECDSCTKQLRAQAQMVKVDEHMHATMSMPFHLQQISDSVSLATDAIEPATSTSRRRLLISRAPCALCVHFHRRHFDARTGNIVKLRQRVRFPLLARLAPFCAYAGAPNMTSVGLGTKITERLHGSPGVAAGAPLGSSCSETHLYELVAVIVHHGSSPDGGHYTTFRKIQPSQYDCGSSDSTDDADQQWVHCDDGNVRQVDTQEVLNCEAYMLFYAGINLA